MPARTLDLNPPRASQTQVLVAGAGAVGLILGIALARAGLDTVVVGRTDAHWPGRTVALLEGSIGFLKTLGLWPELATHAAPLRTMRIVDDTGSLFRVPPVAFRAEEIGQAQFGYNIENARLIERLVETAEQTTRLTLLRQHLDRFEFGAAQVMASLSDGRQLGAAVLAAADGRGSPSRRAAGLTIRTWRYPQAAVTAVLRHLHPHGDVSTEFHTRQGPFTLVPLPGLPDAPYRSSLVWVMSPDEAERRKALPIEEFAAEVERQSRFLLGRIQVESEAGHFPMSGMMSDRMAGPRVALVGEAAHAFPPIGAQGLNLGLRDVATLVDLLAGAARDGRDIGAPELLDRYAARRRGDVALRTMAVDGLNRALLSDALAVDLLRGAGLLALGRIGPLRRFAMREGLMPRGSSLSGPHEP